MEVIQRLVTVGIISASLNDLIPALLLRTLNINR
jgi:hypothetical protein